MNEIISIVKIGSAITRKPQYAKTDVTERVITDNNANFLLVEMNFK